VSIGYAIRALGRETLIEVLAVLIIAFLIVGFRELSQWRHDRAIRHAEERRREEATVAAWFAEEARRQKEREEDAAALHELSQDMKHYFEASRRTAIQDRLREIEERD
jgi:hypothetical protein